MVGASHHITSGVPCRRPEGFDVKQHLHNKSHFVQE